MKNVESATPERPSAAWQNVRCRVDGEVYVCTPSSDYYNYEGAVGEDGVLEGGICEDHLLSEAGFARADAGIELLDGMEVIGKKTQPKPKFQNCTSLVDLSP